MKILIIGAGASLAAALSALMSPPAMAMVVESVHVVPHVTSTFHEPVSISRAPVVAEERAQPATEPGSPGYTPAIRTPPTTTQAQPVTAKESCREHRAKDCGNWSKSKEKFFGVIVILSVLAIFALFLTLFL